MRVARLAPAILAAGLLVSCTANHPKSRYLLAERLFNDGKHAAAVAEFERVGAQDPSGKLGHQALFRAAMTQSWYLQQYGEALRKFRVFSERSDDPDLAWEAEKQIGEILFSKTEQYAAAIEHYRGMLKSRPKSSEAPDFLFRTARANFFLWNFQEAVEIYREIEARFPQHPLAERAALEIGNAYYTQGENGGGAQQGIEPTKREPRASGRKGGVAQAPTGAFHSALAAYERFIQKYPQSQWVPEAKFGIAACQEELEQLDLAYTQFEALLNSYPSPNVIKIKLARIRQRQNQKSR